jgi:hypothetical protein
MVGFTSRQPYLWGKKLRYLLNRKAWWTPDQSACFAEDTGLASLLEIGTARSMIAVLIELSSIHSNCWENRNEKVY